MRKQILGVLLGAFMLAPGIAPAQTASSTTAAMTRMANNLGALQDYTLNCAGCHRGDGAGAPGRVPSLRNSLGSFTHSREGRDYLIGVPGSSESLLTNGELAHVLNFMVARFDPELAGDDFKPFTAGEIGAIRRQRYADIRQVRLRLAEQLQQQGLPTAEYHYGSN